MPTALSKVQVWNGILPDRKVITVTHEGDPVDPGCDNCSAPCCCSFAPILSADEAKSGRYAIDYVPFPEEGIGKTDFVPSPSARVAVVAKKADGTCAHQDQDGRCGIWANRPKSCALYDCRKETRPGLRDFVQKRFYPEMTS